MSQVRKHEKQVRRQKARQVTSMSPACAFCKQGTECAKLFTSYEHHTTCVWSPCFVTRNEACRSAPCYNLCSPVSHACMFPLSVL